MGEAYARDSWNRRAEPNPTPDPGESWELDALRERVEAIERTLIQAGVFILPKIKLVAAEGSKAIPFTVYPDEGNEGEE